MESSFEFACNHCEWTIREPLDEAVRRLRTLGMLKRESHPSLEMVTQLLEATCDRLRCDGCEQAGLAVTVAQLRDDWDRLCERCGKPISLVRLEVIPDCRFCADCQGRQETRGDESDEYCPKCGGMMKTRQSGASGLTRYVLACSDCGFRQR